MRSELQRRAFVREFLRRSERNSLAASGADLKVEPVLPKAAFRPDSASRIRWCSAAERRSTFPFPADTPRRLSNGFEYTWMLTARCLNSAKIQHLVHRFERIDVGGVRRVHFVDVGGDDVTGAVGGVAIVHAKVLHFQAADRRGHPTILVAMIVDAAGLADLPADGHAFEDVRS